MINYWNYSNKYIFELLMSKVVLLLVLILQGPLVKGQLLFQKRFFLNDQTWFNSILELNNAELLIVGTTLADPSTYRTVLLKSDSAGNLISEKYLYFTNGSSLETPQIVRNCDSTISIGGKLNGLGHDNFALCKLDSSGNPMFALEFNLPFGDGFESIIATRDSGNLLIGDSERFSSPLGYTKGIAIKVDKNGSISWVKKFGSGGNTNITSAVEFEDGHFILLVTTSYFSDTINNANRDLLLIEIDNQGSFVHSRLFNSISDSEGYRIFAKDRNNLSIAFTSSDFNGFGKREMCFANFDSLYNNSWSYKYTGFSSGISPDRYSYFKKTIEGGYSFGNNSRFVRLDSIGNYLWQNRIYYITGNIYTDFDDNFSSSIFIAGHTFISPWEGWLVKLSESGEAGCNSFPNDPIFTTPISIALQDTQFYNISDFAVSINYYNEDSLIINSNVECFTYVSDQIQTAGNDRLNVFPSVFSNFINIQLSMTGLYTISVFSLDGKVVYNSQYNNNTYENSEFVLDLEFLISGVYILRVLHNDKTHFFKIIKV